MEDINKLTNSIGNLQPNSHYVIRTGDVVSEETFNSIEWHMENTLTWTLVKAEMDTL